jgi:sulfur relay (sulfurtransferase) DsrF/TusC family protein
MVNTQYSELVSRQNYLSNRKYKDKYDDDEMVENEKKLREFELNLSANDIIDSVRSAFKYVPPRI